MATPVKTRSLTAKPGTSAVGKATSGKATGKSSATTTPQATPAKPRGMFFGLMVLFLGMEVISIGISYLDVATKGALNTPVFFTLPLLGKVMPLTIVFIAAAILLYWLLLRFKLLPTRQSLQQQTALTTTSSRSGAKTSTVAPTPTPSLTSMFSGMFGGLFGGNKADTASAVATPKATSSANSKMATAGRPIGKTKMMAVKVKEEPADGDGDANDEMYNQVKAQLRTQARKKRKH